MGENRSSSPVLVVLAAGMGSRYGGLKQLDAVGPGGATLMDYAVFDAARSGFGGVVFIIRPDMTGFAAAARSRYGARMPVLFAEQRTPQGRAKPCGTGHALLATEDVVAGPFAVVNADDFYGREAYGVVARFQETRAGSRPPEWAVAGYPVMETLSESGTVTRAICRTSDGWLEGLDETALDHAAAAALPEDTRVSMNMWGFMPGIFVTLRREFEAFLNSAAATTGEYLLPDAVGSAIRHGEARVRVLEPDSRWFGLTHAADRARVVAELAALTRSGTYPEKLW